ncbi:uncharacterized protein FOMMEDRAFT_152542 [Fomitiporia mediterranea MF3/22]|uniref:uncharacterized protein n=1 Tax=Fomitiporia mediterranea (strain MF3/22) TaxID=694068 RepID=UPI00044078E0|nr:uncharacterized protein FOMMEDRAFT_152542 [Fomitiporia mediterranea MF3/22]EJD07171.1 hypothetical protein FOMMEDRAFT_152542 [Fomitiporia mediterranea MF3/22]
MPKTPQSQLPSPVKQPANANAPDKLDKMSKIALRKKKNADAQAAFRARRANYIATLEETGPVMDWSRTGLELGSGPLPVHIQVRSPVRDTPGPQIWSGPESSHHLPELHSIGCGELGAGDAACLNQSALLYWRTLLRRGETIFATAVLCMFAVVDREILLVSVDPERFSRIPPCTRSTSPTWADPSSEATNFRMHELRIMNLSVCSYLNGEQRAQAARIRRFFRTFFEDERDIENNEGEFDPHADDESVEIFDSDEEAIEWIQGAELEKEVRCLTANAARKGVAGVPFTVIDGRWAVSGCQKPECYYKIFEKLATCSDVPPPAMMKAEGPCGQRICTPSAATA